MTFLKSSDYFDLSHFEHAVLFDEGLPVWKVVTKIIPSLEASKLGSIEIEIPAGAFLENPELISIGKGTIVESGAYIRGPCKIGKDCEIRHGAYIRGGFICGDRCVIGHDTEIKNAMMLNDVRAGHFAYIADSILGNRVNLGAGTKCANLKLDGTPIILHMREERIQTGLRKFGVIMGDDVQTGCNSVINPGTLLGKRVACYPCIALSGTIEEDTLVKTNTRLLFSPRKREKG